MDVSDDPIKAGDEVVYKNFPSRMKVKRIWRGQAYCRWIWQGRHDGHVCSDLYARADLKRLLPRPSESISFWPSSGMIVRDARAVRNVDMIADEPYCVVDQNGVQALCRCRWQDGGFDFEYWFDIRDLEPSNA